MTISGPSAAAAAATVLPAVGITAGDAASAGVASPGAKPKPKNGISVALAAAAAAKNPPLPSNVRAGTIDVPPPPAAKPKSAASTTFGIEGWTAAFEPVIEWKCTRPAGPRTTWGPFLTRGLPQLGNPAENHWAFGGCLQRLDQVTGSQSALRQREDRFRTLGDVRDQLLKLNDRIDAFNAGHCNLEAMRAAYFEDPRVAVTRSTLDDAWHRSPLFGTEHWPTLEALARETAPFTAALGKLPLVGKLAQTNHVTFSPEDIKLLMMLCMDDLVDAKAGNGGYDYVGFRFSLPANPEGEVDPTHDKEEPYPHDVIEKVVKGWFVKDNTPVIIEVDPRPTLDNRAYDGVRLEQVKAPPRGFDDVREKVPEGGEVRFYKLRFMCQAEPAKDLRQDLWKHTAEDGTVTSGWVLDPERRPLPNTIHKLRAKHGLLFERPRSPNADFFWRAHLLPEEPWIGAADRINPEVDKLEVWSLFMDSIGVNWKAILRDKPERLEEHCRIMEAGNEAVGRLPRPEVREKWVKAGLLPEAAPAAAPASP